VSFCHWVITQGWVDAVEGVTARTCGEPGLRRLDAIAEACCDRPNPVLQVSARAAPCQPFGLHQWRLCL
jgi:hypothetical protein